METFTEIDTYLALHVLGRSRDTWTMENAFSLQTGGHPMDTPDIEADQPRRVPPETSSTLEGRLGVLSFLTLHGCRVASTYDRASYGTMVTVDVLSRTGKRTIWLNGELALEPAMYALAYLFMCDKLDALRHFVDMLEANVATQRFRVEFGVADAQRGQPDGDREIIEAHEAKDV